VYDGLGDFQKKYQEERKREGENWIMSDYSPSFFTALE
jgi:hypothetical protein